MGGLPAPIAEHLAEASRDVVETNLTAVFLTAKVTVPHLRAHGDGGSLVLVSSSLGLRSAANVVGYLNAKWGVVGLLKSLAIELAPDQIRVNSVHPTNV